MTDEKPLINRVAESGLITLNLEDHFPSSELAHFDLKDHLFMGLILKEKDFRAALKAVDWSQYSQKILLTYCSADAIIPVWAYMLVAIQATPYAADVFQGDASTYYSVHYRQALEKIDYAAYAGQRIVIKGCGTHPVPPAAYLELTRRLQPYAQSIMYGEPCSTVPIFKKSKT